MKIFFFICFLSTIICCSLIAQSYDYDFDLCDLNETQSEANSATATQAVLCECGIRGEAISLTNQIIRFPLSFDTLFYENFSLGFSFKLDRLDRNQDLLSKMRLCNSDTVLYIQYQAFDTSLFCLFQEGFTQVVQLKGKLDKNRCWQQVIITKDVGTFRLYINSQQKDQVITRELIRLNNMQPISFNGSPCISNLQKAEGLLDEFFVRNGAMNITEIQNQFQSLDEILTSDTLIFLGATVNLRSVSPCATNISWTPSSSLNNPSVLNPIASPTTQTTYQVVFTYGTCQAKDSVTVKVIDKSKISCEDIRLPSAFSPNQDLLNDRFFISNNYIIQSLEYFDIFDRNGAKVFSASQASDSWDGSFKDKRMNPGKYYYRVSYTCNDEKYNSKGAFFMLK